jgi:hypothetical protein
LNFTGNHLLHWIYHSMGKKIFYPMHTVTNVQLLSNGDIITSAVRKEVSIQL